MRFQLLVIIALALAIMWYLRAGRRGRLHSPNAEADEATVRKAWQVLGLEPGATEDEVVAAHRRLMAKLHPDHGGSDYLASEINQARNVLLRHLKQR